MAEKDITRWGNPAKHASDDGKAYQDVFKDMTEWLEKFQCPDSFIRNTATSMTNNVFDILEKH